MSPKPAESFLVKPDVTWAKTDAYDAGFCIHGIPYKDLTKHGVHLLDVPKRLNHAWRDALLVSDAVTHDAAWIEKAYDAIGQRSPWRMIEFDVAFSALYQWQGLTPHEVANIAVAAERSLPRPHRAGADAQRLHKIARAIVDANWREQFIRS